MMRRTLLAIGLLSFAACGPHQVPYQPPAVEPVPAFRENANWKPAEPQDATVRGEWWEMFNDPALNALEAQVSISNDTLKVFEAQFAQARALVRSSQSARYPQVTAAPTASAEQTSGNRAVSSFHDPFTDFVAPASVSYEADLWGRIHNSVTAAQASAQASAADLENARLSAHAELAIDYFMLHGLDRDKELLDSAVDAYQRALVLTQNRFSGGIASQSDVALAETQLESTRAQAVDVDAQRALLEHAIAVLVGRPASLFSIPPAPLTAVPPGIPAGIPSQLLERRPDIAGAERRVAASNAQIGVATAAFYPLVTLSGGAGFESSSLATLLTATSNFWSIAPAALATVFDGGRRHAQADLARAEYQEAAASYQGSVLTAFREVEDQLSTLRVLEQEAAIQDRAVDAAERSLALANNRYRGGVTTYLEVVTAQTAALVNERVAAELQVRRVDASVLLLKAIGGGWNPQTLPAMTAVGR